MPKSIKQLQKEIDEIERLITFHRNPFTLITYNLDMGKTSPLISIGGTIYE